jgi:TolB-like protein/Flp pilus assembly protein TadD
MLSYTVAVWLILQIAEVVVEPLGLPESGLRYIIIGGIASVPIALYLAWIIDLRQHGLIFDLPLWTGGTAPEREPRKADLVMGLFVGSLVITSSCLLALFLNERIPSPQVEDTSVVVPQRAQNSIAVLAFENFGNNPDSDYFASGLAEEILDLLASMKELNVAARTSSFRFRGEKVDIREVARLLGVKHVLEGSVRREGDRIRLTAQLIDGVDGYHTWSKTYDRNLIDTFAIQQEIAAAVVNELKIALSVGSESALDNVPTADMDAYIFYLQGRDKLHSSRDVDVLKKSRLLFERAIEIDPDFSRAYAGICEAGLEIYEHTNNTTDFEAAKLACSKAEALAPGLNSEIYIALGRLYRHRGWYAQATEKLEQAIAVTPGAVDAYIELAKTVAATGDKVKSEALLLRAVDLKRNYWKSHEALASFYYRSERYREAADAYEIVTSLTPDVSATYAAKAGAYFMLGNSKKARAAALRSLEIKPSRQAYTNLGLFNYYEGRFVEAATAQKEALELAPEDHRVWGRLGDCYRFIPGSESKATQYYERAAELAEENLTINQEDWMTRGQLGLYLAHIDQPGRALSELGQALKESNQNPEMLYLMALVKLDQGEQDEALSLMESAVAAGNEYRQFVKTDPDLQVLRHEDRFTRLLPAAQDI